MGGKVHEVHMRQIAFLALIMIASGVLGWSLGSDRRDPAHLLREPAPRQTTVEDYVRVFGANSEAIRLVIYFDVECPFCSVLHSHIIPRLGEKYDFEIVYRYFPLKSRTYGAYGAYALECAASLGGKDMFWRYLEHLYANASQSGNHEREDFSSGAEFFGISRDALVVCIDSERTRQRIAVDAVEGALLGVSITPTVIVERGERRYMVIGANEVQLEAALLALNES